MPEIKISNERVHSIALVEFENGMFAVQGKALIARDYCTYPDTPVYLSYKDFHECFKQLEKALERPFFSVVNCNFWSLSSHHNFNYATAEELYFELKEVDKKMEQVENKPKEHGIKRRFVPSKKDA